MSVPLADPVAILSELVSFRTDLTGDERALAERLADLLRLHDPDEVTVGDVPRPSGPTASWVYARFGQPRLLVNAHLDTVPPNAGWSSDPFVPTIEGGRLYALGAADTKGAAAAILAALADVRPKDTAILFSGDEEVSSVVMRDFVAGPRRAGLERAIVCEPTNLKIGVRHRGFIGFDVALRGPGGHSSQADALPAPVADLARVAVALDAWGRKKKSEGPPGYLGMCLNIAKLDGGITYNVVPAEARLLVSLRPPPGADTSALRGELEALVRGVAPEGIASFVRLNAPFATNDLGAFEQLLGDAVREPRDLGFWTEAALLAADGVDAVVFGPGAIAQAHAADEWVTLDELRRARDVFRAAFQATTRA